MQVFPNARHGHCVWHLSQNVKVRVKTEKEEAAANFIACAHVYTQFEFTREYARFRRRFPNVGPYLDRWAPVENWAMCYFEGDRYNIDTSNACESLNSTFERARKYFLLPLLDAIIEKISEWFNKHRKESVKYSETRGLVPVVENEIHSLCPIAKTMPVTELNSFERQYSVIGEGGMSYSVDLLRKTCSCRRFDVDKYPCVHAIAAARNFVGTEWILDGLEMEDLTSHYYHMNTWILAYHRTIYPVPHSSVWIIPDEIRQLIFLPPDTTTKPGRNQETRFPSTGERRRKRTNNKFQPGINNNAWLQPEESAS